MRLTCYAAGIYIYTGAGSHEHKHANDCYTCMS